MEAQRDSAQDSVKQLGHSNFCYYLGFTRAAVRCAENPGGTSARSPDRQFFSHASQHEAAVSARFETHNHDVLIIGGGAAGLRAAIAVAEVNPKLSVA